MNIDRIGITAAEVTQQADVTSIGRASSSTGTANAQPAATEDKTTFASNSAAVQTLTKAAIHTFPSRESKVESLRQAVNSAQYQLDADKIAESLVSAEA